MFKHDKQKAEIIKLDLKKVRFNYLLCMRDTNRLKEKGWEEINHVNGNHKRAEVAILNTRQTSCEDKRLTRD